MFSSRNIGNYYFHNVLGLHCQWTYLVYLITKPNQDIDEDLSEVEKVLRVLDTELEMKTFFVGDRLSLADICLACSLMILFERGLSAQERQGPFSNLSRWFDTVINQDAFVQVMGSKFKYCQAVEKVSLEGSPDLLGFLFESV